MRLGGLTWWRNNYGSILQAYALQQELNSIPNISYEIINQYGKKIASVDNLLDKIKTLGFCKTAQRVVWKFGMKKLRNRSTNTQKFIDKRLKVSPKQYTEKNIAEANSEYDGFVCGSDQIWNPTLTELDSMYWLGFSDDRKLRFAYAPSIGVDDVSDKEAKTIQKNLNRFYAISCREEAGTQLLNRIIGKQVCETVLDPTLLVDRKIWDQMCPVFRSEPYIFVYMLRGTKEQRQIIERFAESVKMKIVTMPFMEAEYPVWYDFKFGDKKIWDAAPDEFVSSIRNAAYVFTDSFHSSVFSILYHVPFFNFPKRGKAQMSRIKGLQNLLQIDSRMVNSEDDVNRVAQKQIDWETVDNILEEARKQSRNYIRNILQKYSSGECVAEQESGTITWKSD